MHASCSVCSWLRNAGTANSQGPSDVKGFHIQAFPQCGLMSLVLNQWASDLFECCRWLLGGRHLSSPAWHQAQCAMGLTVSSLSALLAPVGCRLVENGQASAFGKLLIASRTSLGSNNYCNSYLTFSRLVSYARQEVLGILRLVPDINGLVKYNVSCACRHTNDWYRCNSYAQT